MRITKYTETVFRDRVYIDIEGIAEPCMRPAKPLKGDPHGKPAERLHEEPQAQAPQTCRSKMSHYQYGDGAIPICLKALLLVLLLVLLAGHFSWAGRVEGRLHALEHPNYVELPR